MRYLEKHVPAYAFVVRADAAAAAATAGAAVAKGVAKLKLDGSGSTQEVGEKRPRGFLVDNLE